MISVGYLVRSICGADEHLGLTRAIAKKVAPNRLMKTKLSHRDKETQSILKTR